MASSGDEVVGTDVGAHERELAAALTETASEYPLADWATSNLAVVLDTAGRLPPPPAEDPEHPLRRAVLVSSARIFRHARAGMAVVAAGYEGEARMFDRTLLETRARRLQVLNDPSGELARKWLAGKLEGSIGAAVRASVADPEGGRAVYRQLSGDVHPDLPQFMGALIREGVGGGVEMGFSPHRSSLCRRSLVLYAWVAWEATDEVGARTGIKLPHHHQLRRELLLAGDRLVRDLGASAG